MGRGVSRRPEYTFLANAGNGRHGWLRLTPAYSAHLVEERLRAYERTHRVLDPFCGTGTTPLIAGYFGFEATAVEINPFLAWFSRVKTLRYPESVLTQTLNMARNLVQRRSELCTAPVELPPIHTIERWWDEDALRWLASLKATMLQGCPADDLSTYLIKVAFARCVIKLSKAAYHHPSVSFRETHQLNLNLMSYDALFLQEVEWVAQSARENPICEPRIVCQDARELERLNEKFDLVITSPPYANRISYIRELRPYMYWLGFLSDGRTAGELDWQAIGGTWGTATSRLKQWSPQLPVDDTVAEVAAAIRKAHPKNGTLLANYVLKYFEDMQRHISSLKRVLNGGARIHYIVGNSSFYGIVVPVEQVLAPIFRVHGFEFVRVSCLRKRNCKRELYEYEITGTYTGA